MSLPTVKQYMDTEVHRLAPSDDILSAVRLLIQKSVTGAVVVDEQGGCVGLLTERDCLRLLTHGGVDADVPSGAVSAYMSAPEHVVPSSANIYFVAGLFLSSTGRRIPVVDDGIVVGVITRKDVLRAIESNFPEAS